MTAPPAMCQYTEMSFNRAVSRTDPLTIAAVVATLLGVALVASAVPARRAATVDPTRALQSE